MLLWHFLPNGHQKRQYRDSDTSDSAHSNYILKDLSKASKDNGIADFPPPKSKSEIYIP